MPAEIDDKPLGRKVCNESIVFYRGADGAVAPAVASSPVTG